MLLLKRSSSRKRFRSKKKVINLSRKNLSRRVNPFETSACCRTSPCPTVATPFGC